MQGEEAVKETVMVTKFSTEADSDDSDLQLHYATPQLNHERNC